MAHSLQYQITESVHAIEVELGRLLNVVDSLKAVGNEDLASTVVNQAQKLVEVAIALRIAIAKRNETKRNETKRNGGIGGLLT